MSDFDLAALIALAVSILLEFLQGLGDYFMGAVWAPMASLWRDV